MGFKKTIELLKQLANTKKNLVEKLVNAGTEASYNEPLQDLIDKVKGETPSTFILRDEAGTEITATLVSEETVFTATANDIREGMIAATDKGVTTGTKVIPSYHTTEGYRLITDGSVFQTYALTESDKYDFTRLQAIICPFNENINKSVAADKVAINESVYAVTSAEVIATVLRDSENKTINLGFTNNSGKTYVLRFFTYKEIN